MLCKLFFLLTTAEKFSFLQMVFQVYDSELCMLALPPDEQQLLSRISQFLFCRGIIPVVVRNPAEALIHSRHSQFVVIILPDSDPLLIRNIRSVKQFYMNLKNLTHPVYIARSRLTHALHSPFSRSPKIQVLSP